MLTEQGAEIHLADDGQDHLAKGDNMHSLEAQSGQPYDQAPSDADTAGALSWEMDVSQRLLFWEDVHAGHADMYDMHFQAWTGELAIGAEEMERYPLCKHLYPASR